MRYPWMVPARLGIANPWQALRGSIDKRRRSAVFGAVGLVLIVNAVLLAAYLWSRGGETTVVRVEVRGSEFKTFVDGKVRAAGSFPLAPKQGGVALTMEDVGLIPSLPSPRGIDYVKVTDLDSGSIILDDGFDPIDATAWKQVPADIRSDSGAVSFTRSSLVSAGSWQNYAVEASFRNIVAATIVVRTNDGLNGVVYWFRPFRHFDNALSFIDQGKLVEGAAGRGLQLTRTETLKSITAMVLRPYVYVLPFLLAGSVIAVPLCLLGLPSPPRLGSISLSWWVPVLCLTTAALAVTLYLIYVVAAHVPHVPDEVSFIFQAKVLASGHLSAPPPRAAEAFDFFYPGLIVVSQGKWASVYPFGHPLALVLGVKIGAVWLVPPLLGAACIVLVFIVGRRIYSPGVALMSSVLLAASPFYLMTASNFMSHNTAAFYILLSLVFLAYRDRRPVAFGFLSGLFFGLFFNTRPLTSFALIPPFGLMLLSPILTREWRFAVRSVGAFLLGGLLMLGAYFAYNLGTTGDAFKSGYEASASVSQVVGFGGRHTLEAGLQNEQTQMTFLLLVLNGWPTFVGLIFVLLPFILGSRSVWDWFLLACAVSILSVWTLYEGNGVMHGPRYWYEAAPFLALLTARGAQAASQLVAGLANRTSSFLFNRQRTLFWPAGFFVYGAVGVLIVWSLYGWLLGERQDWQADLVPNRAAALRNFNGINDRLVKAVEEANLKNALVMVESCPNWQCYGNVFWLNSPRLDGDVVLARDLGRKNGPTFAAYPERNVYFAKYAPPSLQPWDLSSDSGQATLTAAPLAKDIPLPEPPVPTPVDTAAGAERRDEQRRRDLAAMREALNRYYAAYGEYPEAKYTQTFCGYAFDSGCKVREFLNPLPVDPATRPNYWYQSDRASFVMFVALESLPGPEEACAEPIPVHLSGVPNLICTGGDAGAPR